MNREPAPERLIPKQITVYETERQCLAPKCGRWFVPNTERQRWCSRRCNMRAFRAGLAFRVELKPSE